MSPNPKNADFVAGGRSGSSIMKRVSTKADNISTRYAYDMGSKGSKRVDGKRQTKPADLTASDDSTHQAVCARTRKEPTKSACSRCQKRKTKCPGQRPVCRSCSDRNLECSWDVSDGLTRTADLKKKLQEAVVRLEGLDVLVNAMRSGTDDMSTMLLASLRLGASVEGLVRII